MVDGERCKLRVMARTLHRAFELGLNERSFFNTEMVVFFTHATLLFSMLLHLRFERSPVLKHITRYSL